MARSYLFITKEHFTKTTIDELKQADAIIFSLDDMMLITNEYKLYHDKIEHLCNYGTKFFVKLNTSYKNSCRTLDLINHHFIAGWFIPHASKGLMNKLSIKAREYEVSKKMDFNTIKFIPILDTPNSIIQSRKIARYERVIGLYVDTDKYLNYLGFEDLRDRSKTQYIRERISLDNDISKKELIDTACNDSEMFSEDILFGKSLGAFSKATYRIDQIEAINRAYTPTSEEINRASLVLDKFNRGSVKKIKNYLLIDAEEVSCNVVLKSYMIINRAMNLGLIPKESESKIVVKDEAVRKSKQLKPIKFYTFGEEIGNAVTHGIGILFGILFLILLLIKGINNGNNTSIVAYTIYTTSIIILYLMSTLYHGMPLNSSSKRLFQRFDHMTIYLLIAGTYTPYSLLAVNGEKGLSLCIFLWSGALIGLLLNLFMFGRFKKFHMALYLILGWVAVFYLPIIIKNIGIAGTILLIGGGISYTLGTIFYSMKLFKYTHMVWHIFVLIGTILHFLSIFLYV